MGIGRAFVGICAPAHTSHHDCARYSLNFLSWSRGRHTHKRNKIINFFRVQRASSVHVEAAEEDKQLIIVAEFGFLYPCRECRSRFHRFRPGQFAAHATLDCNSGSFFGRRVDGQFLRNHLNCRLQRNNRCMYNISFLERSMAFFSEI